MSTTNNAEIYGAAISNVFPNLNAAPHFGPGCSCVNESVGLYAAVYRYVQNYTQRFKMPPV